MTAGEVRLRPDGPDGSRTLLAVHAQPGARRPGVLGVFDGHLKVAVAAPPEAGRANAAVEALLAELFGLRPSSVALVRGHSSRRKLLALALGVDEVRGRLAELGETRSTGPSQLGPLASQPVEEKGTGRGERI